MNTRPPGKRKTRRKKPADNIRGQSQLLIKWLMLFVAVVFSMLVATMLTFRFINPPTWSWKLHRDLSQPLGYPAVVRHQWRDIEQIPPIVQLAVVASEDQNFPHHHGVDFAAIQKALHEAKEGKVLRGASTITQQTVKNLFLWPQKAWSRKVLEGGLALLLELLWSKERILEVYLNIVEFGPGVYGVAAASEYWYQTSMDQLSINQAARLVAVLPNPWRYKAEPPTPYISERSLWIETQMDKLGYVWLMPVSGW
ncbi:MAG: monofunctional biosynthetic peptidoglycan transglycosylase [Chromatiales bacterium]